MKHLPKNVTSDHNKQKKNTTLHKEMWKIVCSFNILKSLTKRKKKKNTLTLLQKELVKNMANLEIGHSGYHWIFLK